MNIELPTPPQEPHVALTITSYPQSGRTNVTGPLNEPPMCLGLIAQGLGLVIQQIEKQGGNDAVLALRIIVGNLVGLANHLGKEQATRKPGIITDVAGVNGNALRVG